MGRMRSRQPGDATARRRPGMSWRLLGTCSATLLAVGLLSAIPVAAGAQRPVPRAPIPPRLTQHAWPRARQTLHHARSTVRAPFLSWSSQKTVSAASIVNTYKVTTTADTTPAACPATTTEQCTLRQAVIQANTDGTLDEIQVPAAASPYLLESDQLVVTDPAGVVISGKSQTKTVVQADGTSPSYPFRVLQIDSGSNVQISNMTIENGESQTPSEDGYGGGIEVLSGSLTMRNSTVTGNAAEHQGGGIYVAGANSIDGSSGNQSQAYLKNVTISGNDAGDGGGGLDVEGQAIMQGVVSDNIGGELGGGGILLDDDGAFFPSLSASDLSVSGNLSLGEGGGIANYGSLTLSGGVIGGTSKAEGNIAQAPLGTLSPGGGLYNHQVAILSNVALLHNKALYGGGIENDDRVSVTGGAVSGNRAQDAAGLDNEGGQVTLSGVKVSGNRAKEFAGGLGNINNGSSVSITGGLITRNSAPLGGGGIYSDAPAGIEGTSITGNSARNGGGGGIYSDAPMTLHGVQLGTAAEPNAAQLGGGLYTQNVGATIVRSTIEGNQARDAGAGTGGGIFNSDTATDHVYQTTVGGNSSDSVGGGVANSGGSMTIARSTISGNSVISGAAEAFGGGVSNADDPSNGDTATLNMVNDTLTGNQAGGGSTAGFGGGLANETQASATLTNVTVSRNRAGSTGTGGGIYNNGQAALRGTIVAKNTAAHASSNCGLTEPLTSNGYNLSTDSTCGLTGIGDQTGVNPLLEPLANNGGPTETQALKAGSPAIDAVQFCPPPKTDQRGVNRQGPCDVGAYERVPDGRPLVFSPSPFDYGSVMIRHSVSQKFTLKNSGGSDRRALKITLSGSSAFKTTSDTCTGTTLAPGKSCTVTVRFTARTGAAAATLKASSHNATATDSLTGTGAHL